MADTYHALADAGYLDNTVLIVTFDEWGGFFDHVPPPQVIDDTNPDDVDHGGDSSTPTDGQLIPDYRQLGIRGPVIVVSNLAPRRVVNHGPFEHTSTLKMIESVFGLNSLTARDAQRREPGHGPGARPVAGGRHPDQQPGDGPVSDAAAICSADSVQSVSPKPVKHGPHLHVEVPVLPQSGWPTGSGMVGFGKEHRKNQRS